jgi:hypothetical protein
MDTMNTCYIKGARRCVSPGTFWWDGTKRDLIGMWMMVEYDGTGATIDLVVTDSAHRVVGAGQIKPQYLSVPVFVRFS